MANVKDTIRSIAYDQHEILYNILQLHNGGEPFECDMTYSKGAFYGDFNVTTIDGERKQVSIPRPTYTFDVAPQDDETVKIEPEGDLPLNDNSIDSICFDPPFVVSCGPSMSGPDYDENGKRVKNNMISRRFSSYYPAYELTRSYLHWMREIYRVLKPNGIAVVKCQKTVTGSKALNSPEFLWFVAECLGFDMIDSFMLLAKMRLISGKVHKQQHARRFESEFLVFKKSQSKKFRYLQFLSEEEAAELTKSFIANNLPKRKK